MTRASSNEYCTPSKWICIVSGFPFISNIPFLFIYFGISPKPQFILSFSFSDRDPFQKLHCNHPSFHWVSMSFLLFNVLENSACIQTEFFSFCPMSSSYGNCFYGSFNISFCRISCLPSLLDIFLFQDFKVLDLTYISPEQLKVWFFWSPVCRSDFFQFLLLLDIIDPRITL